MLLLGQKAEFEGHQDKQALFYNSHVRIVVEKYKFGAGIS